MRITADMTLAGYSIRAIRTLFRVALVDGDTLERVQEVLHLDTTQAQQLLHTLQQEGYVEPDMRFPQQDMWRSTTKGNALAMASAAKPISRATAERLVAELVERVRNVNAEPTFVYRVAKVVAFGSYVSDAPTLGDVDVALTIRPKYPDVDDMRQRSQERIEHALQAGRAFRTTTEQVAWPLLEVHRFLKGRSRAISLHVLDREQALLQGSKTKVLFDDQDDLAGVHSPSELSYWCGAQSGHGAWPRAGAAASPSARPPRQGSQAAAQTRHTPQRAGERAAWVAHPASDTKFPTAPTRCSWAVLDLDARREKVEPCPRSAAAAR